MNKNQGKSPKQYKDSAMFTLAGMLGIVILLLILVISSCTETNQKQHNFQVGELTAQDSLELKEPDAIYYDTIYDDMWDIDMDCGDSYYDSIPEYSSFNDVPASIDTVIRVDGILYKINNNINDKHFLAEILCSFYKAKKKITNFDIKTNNKQGLSKIGNNFNINKKMFFLLKFCIK